MARKVLFTASTYSHIVNFHLPYLRRFREEGWEVHVACGGAPMDVSYVDKVTDLPFEKSMWSPKNFRATVLLSDQMRREGYALICTHTTLLEHSAFILTSSLSYTLSSHSLLDPILPAIVQPPHCNKMQNK